MKVKRENDLNTKKIKGLRRRKTKQRIVKVTMSQGREKQRKRQDNRKLNEDMEVGKTMRDIECEQEKVVKLGKKVRTSLRGNIS